MKKCLITTTIIIILFFAFSTSVKANAAIFYPNEVEIEINNLPQNEKIKIEILVVMHEIDTVGKNTSSVQEYIDYLKEANDRLVKEIKPDGSYKGLKNETIGYDSETKQWKHAKIPTTYYYKLLNKKTIYGKESVKLNIFPVKNIISNFQDGMVIKINDKYSMPASLGNLGKPEINKNYYSLDYQTMNLERIYENDVNNSSVIQLLYNALHLRTLLNIILCIVFTIVIELLISKFFKINNKKIILKVNLLTQVFLHIITLIILVTHSLFYSQYIEILVVLEIIIMLVEFLLYKKNIKDISAKRLIVFSIIANICSFLVTPIINIISNSF